MNKIEKGFKNGKALITFLVAGDPNLDKTSEYILEMEKAGADIIEIGIPFSDPIAEGEVIQRANCRALLNDKKLDDIFLMVKKVREKSNIPLVFLTYLNPVYNYGYEAYFKKCMECEIDGIIIPDLPFEEQKEILDYTNKYDISLISLIALTSEERIQKIASSAKGFIYLVSSLGVTGIRKEINTNFNDIISQIRKYTNKKIAIGFGISTAEQAKKLSVDTDGVIIGSAIVKIIEEYHDHAHEALYHYVLQIKNDISLKN